jgi:hypothetical protein
LVWLAIIQVDLEASPKIFRKDPQMQKIAGLENPLCVVAQSRMSSDGLQQIDREGGDSDSVAPREVGVIPPMAVASERWTAPYAYSRVLSSSMKKIISTRPRVVAMGVSILGGGGGATDEECSSASQSRAQEMELFIQFAGAVSRRDKEAMLSLVMQHPQIVLSRHEVRLLCVDSYLHNQCT